MYVCSETINLILYGEQQYIEVDNKTSKLLTKQNGSSSRWGRWHQIGTPSLQEATLDSQNSVLSSGLFIHYDSALKPNTDHAAAVLSMRSNVYY